MFKANIPIRGQANTVKSIEIGENAWWRPELKFLKFKGRQWRSNWCE